MVPPTQSVVKASTTASCSRTSPTSVVPLSNLNVAPGSCTPHNAYVWKSPTPTCSLSSITKVPGSGRRSTSSSTPLDVALLITTGGEKSDGVHTYVRRVVSKSNDGGVRASETE